MVKEKILPNWLIFLLIQNILWLLVLWGYLRLGHIRLA